MSWVATALAVTGAAVSAKGEIDAGKASKKAAFKNAAQQEQDAIARTAEAISQSRESRAQGRRITGSQKSQYLKGGVLLEGTPLMVMAEAAADIELESMEIERQGIMEAQVLKRGADMSRFKGKQAAKAGRFGAIGTILQSGADIAGTYKQQKLFDTKDIPAKYDAKDIPAK